jgi:hypothetical protein
MSSSALPLRKKLPKPHSSYARMRPSFMTGTAMLVDGGVSINRV